MMDELTLWGRWSRRYTDPAHPNGYAKVGRWHTLATRLNAHGWGVTRCGRTVRLMEFRSTGELRAALEAGNGGAVCRRCVKSYVSDAAFMLSAFTRAMDRVRPTIAAFGRDLSGLGEVLAAIRRAHEART